MRIKRIHLENFQAIKHLDINPECKDMSIYGDNGTGKSTIVNAFYWLWFGKPSTGEKNYTPKTTDTHKLGHVVEIEMDVDGKGTTLRKDFHEVYKSKRSSPLKEFSGHESTFYVDGAEVKQKDFQKKLDEICPPKEARSLVDLNYFLEETPIKDRREELIRRCGDLPAEEAYKNFPELEEIKSFSGGKEVTDVQMVLKTEKKSLNKKIDGVPERIDELRKSLPDEMENKEDLEKELEALKTEKEELEQKKAAGQSGKIAEIQKEIAELEVEKEKAEMDYLKACSKEAAEFAEKIRKLKKQKADIEIKIKMSEARHNQHEENVVRMEQERSQLVKQWQEINSKEFQNDGICPTCGQALPESMIEQARKEFNVKKSNELEEISVKGNLVSKDKIEEEKQRIIDCEKSINDLDGEILKIEDELKSLEEKTGNYPAFSDTKQCLDFVTKIRNLKQKYELEKSFSDNDNVDVLQKISETEQKINSVLEKLSILKTAEKTKERISELEHEQKTYFEQSEEIEYRLKLCDDFQTKRAEMMEERINSRFKNLKFRLFRKLVNGEIEDDCEALIPCASGLIPFKSANHAARVNAGLEIIEELGKFYGYEMPIFLDECQSVTSIKRTQAQQIRLYVSEKDKELRCKNG